VDGSRRFKWRGSVNRIAKKFGQGHVGGPQGLGAFGSHLEDIQASPNNSMVPYLVEICCGIVEEKGLRTKGIYRVPGNSSVTKQLQEEINLRGVDCLLDPEDPKFNTELNCVSSLLKHYFRTLLDPLFTNELYQRFIQTSRDQKDDMRRLEELRVLVHLLPAPHYETLKFLIQHLRKIADNHEHNMMSVKNLAIMFGPTLVRVIPEDMTVMIRDMSEQCKIVESILTNENYFFTGEHEEIPAFGQN